MDEYTITAISYSYRTDITNSGAEDPDNPGELLPPSNDLDGEQPHDVEYTLVAHISFKYYLRGQEYAGTCVADLGTIGTLNYTSTAIGVKATTYTAGEIDPETMTYADIESDITDAVEAELKSIQLKTLAEDTAKSVVGKLEINPELTFNTEYSTPTLNSNLYPELADWNTGIGAYPTNILDLGD